MLPLSPLNFMGVRTGDMQFVFATIPLRQGLASAPSSPGFESTSSRAGSAIQVVRERLLGFGILLRPAFPPLKPVQRAATK
jgi:hypothetical protein